MILPVMVVSSLVLTAFARGTGSLTVLPLCGSREVPGGVVTVYYIGEPVSGGFRLTGKLSHNVLPEKDALSEEFLQWILKRLPGNGISAPVTENRGAVFSDLKPGLYLVKQTGAAPGYSCFRPFLLPVPLGEQWDIAANPKVTQEDDIPETGDDFSPVFGMFGMLFSLLGFGILEKKRRG